MRALLLTVGSQGDVQPFVALAARLRAAGHEVTLAAPALYGSLAASWRVPFAPLDLDMTEVGDAVAGKSGLRHMLAFTRAMGRRAHAILPAVAAACQEPDIVVHHPVLPLGQHLAEALEVPSVLAPPLPALVPTREFASPAWPCSVRLPGLLHRPSYPAARYLTGAWCRRDVDRWRRDALGLPQRKGRHDPLSAANTPVLHSFSEHVVPRPADWPDTAHITGYWFLPETGQNWTPPRRLAEFLQNGPAPVYLGFGSMPVDDPARLATSIITASKATGARLIVASHSPELRRRLPATATNDQILVIRHAPHQWLFPRVAGVIHHGGAGTTGAAVAAGRPQSIWPFGIDQHFWASKMTSLGVASGAQPVRRLGGPALAEAVGRVITDPGMCAAAARLAGLVRAEDGTGAAVAQLERIARSVPAIPRPSADQAAGQAANQAAGQARTVPA
jgi:sterol 3beta-glucosyltransferase